MVRLPLCAAAIDIPSTDDSSDAICAWLLSASMPI